MTTIPELLRSRAVQIGEIRRTGRKDLASALLRDLYLIAEGMEVNKPAHLIAEMLSDSPVANVPAPEPDVSVYPYLATFRGQGEQLGHVVDLDDRHQFPVTAAEAHDAAGPDDLADAVEFDALAEAAMAPAQVREWSGPFEIDVARRLYRIEQAGQDDVYADTIDDAKTLITNRLIVDSQTLGDAPIPEPAIATVNALSDAEMVRQKGTIVIVGVGQDLRIVQQDPELSADRDAIF